MDGERDMVPAGSTDSYTYDFMLCPSRRPGASIGTLACQVRCVVPAGSQARLTDVVTQPEEGDCRRRPFHVSLTRRPARASTHPCAIQLSCDFRPVNVH